MDKLDLTPVAWRVRDFADGWIFFDDREAAMKTSGSMGGALVEALYAGIAQRTPPMTTTETDALVREARAFVTKWGAPRSRVSQFITRLADALAASPPRGEPEQVAREALEAAFEQGCIAAHLAIQNEPELALMPVGDAEFGEAATDYATTALAKMGAKL